MSAISYDPLPFSRYEQSPDELAQSLLGKLLIHKTPHTFYSGIIVETESYNWRSDPACHGYRNITPRNRIMFEWAGYIYMYRSYGIHTCFNITAAPAGDSGAVLVRAVQPIDGIEAMYKNRAKAKRDRDLCSGPWKVCEAMELTMDLYGHQLDQFPLVCADIWVDYTGTQITQTTRIGLTKWADLPLRRYVTDNPHVSRKIKKIHPRTWDQISEN